MTLIEKLEAADGPSYALEQEIFRAVNPHVTKYSIPPNYTASIDAALTLIPEEMRDEIEISTLYCVARVAINLNHAPDDGPHYGSSECNSIPIALCIAALRAREQ